MARTVRDNLVAAMEDLTDRSFRKFRDKLLDCEIKAGYAKIQRARIIRADREDIVDLIRSHYTDTYGPELMIDVLNAINEKQVALDLKRNLEKAGKRHFIDRHSANLIGRIYLVDPILDGLLQHWLITEEQYSIVRSKRTSQEKMREILRYARAWGNRSKDVLYNLLKECNGALIRDLESSEELAPSQRVAPDVPDSRPPIQPAERAESNRPAPSGFTDALTCCVCMEIFTDPASLPCGHNYCLVCITTTWENQHAREASCPLCGRTYVNRPELTKNWGLSQLVEEYRRGQRS